MELNKKILFIDLDGTLIKTHTGKTFPESIWDMEFRFDVLNKIKESKIDYVFIITNQGGLGTYVSYEDFEAKLNYVVRSISAYCECKVVDSIYCDSNDARNDLRKPNTGMIRAMLLKHVLLAWAHNSDMFMVGDASGKPGDFSDSDKKCAENFGIDYYDVEDFIKI